MNLTKIATAALAVLVCGLAVTPNAAAACCVNTYQYTFGGAAVVGTVYVYLDGDEIHSNPLSSLQADKTQAGLEPDSSGQCDAAAWRTYNEELSGAVKGQTEPGGYDFIWTYMGLTFSVTAEVIDHPLATSYTIVGMTVNVPESQLVTTAASPIIQLVAAFLFAVLDYDEAEKILEEVIENIGTTTMTGITARVEAYGNGLVFGSNNGPYTCGL